MQENSLPQESRNDRRDEFAQEQERAEKLSQMGLRVLEECTGKKGEAYHGPSWGPHGMAHWNPYAAEATFWVGDTYEDVTSFSLYLDHFEEKKSQLYLNWTIGKKSEDPIDDKEVQELVHEFPGSSESITEDMLRIVIKKRLEEDKNDSLPAPFAYTR